MSNAFHHWEWKMATYLTYPLLLLHVTTNLVDLREDDLIYNKTVMTLIKKKTNLYFSPKSCVLNQPD